MDNALFIKWLRFENYLDNMYKQLYNINVKNIFDILTSKARAVILRTLYFQERPIPLRHVSQISNLPIFSVQNAVSSLLNEKIISKTEIDSNVLFELNNKHPLYDILEQFFIVEMNYRIRRESAAYYQKAKQVLAFVGDTNALFRKTKLKRYAR